jgi:hypothetical protein
MSNNNLIIIMLLVTLLVIGISAFLVNFLVKTIALDSKLVSKKLAAEKQLKENIVAAPNLIEAYRDLGEERVLLEDALPTTTDFPGLLVTLENMSKDATVQLTAVRESLANTVAVPVAAPAAGDAVSGTSETTQALPASEPAAVTPKPEAYNFTINVKGGYAALLTVLDHIEKSARPMRVTGMEIIGSTTLDIDLNVETYYQKPSELPFGKETVK